MILPLLAAISALGAPDPFAPLRLYDGHWRMTSSAGKQTDLVNHCARLGAFFACDQVVDGKDAALVVFLPTGRAGDVQTYHTQALTPDGPASGAWFTLTIRGPDWTYEDSGKEKGGKVWRRTLNQFTGPDEIHFEVQRSADGAHWTTTLSGEERRAPA